MLQIDKEIINFITKYPFVTDPIVLFNPEKIPSKKEIIKWKLDLKYPEIDKNLKNINKVKEDFFELVSIIENHKFKNRYNEIEYKERIKDFYKIIRIIEIFYEKEEYEKFNLINEYFWIDFELLDEIFCNENKLKEAFKNEKWLISKEKKKSFENTIVDCYEIKKYFDIALKYLDLDKSWRVKIWEVISIVHTNFNQKWWEILIPKNYKTNIKHLIELIAHEIDWHCVQFSNCKWLFSWSIRFSKSESLVEWYAMFLEFFLESFLFWESSIQDMINRNYLRYRSYEDSDYLSKYLDYVKEWSFRFFRWFNSIYKYKNLKDFVYIQWLYNIIKYNKKYSNFYDLIRSWAINDSYIKKYWISEWRKKSFNIKNTSAYNIYTKYFSK